MSGNANDDRKHTEQSPSHGVRSESLNKESASHTYPESDLQPAVRRRESVKEKRYLEPKPLEPQPINAENAAFVLLGVAFVVGLFVAAVLGI